MTPGAAHDRLMFLVGSWEVTSTMHFNGERHQSSDTTHSRWLPGGVWLESNSVMPNTPIGPMFGSARIAWDGGAEEYVRHWIDNQSHVVLTQRGTFTDDRTLTFSGSFEWVDGRVFHQRLEVRRLPDGGWMEVGSMGLDASDLRPNHEGVARRIGS